MENSQIVSPNTDSKNKSDMDSFNIPVSTTPATSTPTVSDFTSSSVSPSNPSFDSIAPSSNQSSPSMSSTPPSSDFGPIPGLNMDRADPRKPELMTQPKSKLSAPIHGQNYGDKGSKIMSMVLALIVLLLIIGGIYGVYDWQHRKVTQADNVNTALNSEVSSLQTQLNTANKSLATAKAALNNSSINVSALGISLSVPTSLKDLTMATNTTPTKLTVNGASVTPIEVNLSSTSLATLDSACSTAKAALGVLSKTTGQYPATPTASNSSGTLIEQFSSYYLAYSVPVACSKVASTNATQTSLVNNLIAALTKTNITVN
jgi:hypothetical protein